MKLSIIIPAYNVEKYIEKCITSCLKQNYSSDNYEIIIVNDGSTDKSLIIAEGIAKDNVIVKVISQENKGLSGARNTGLSEARGEFVWFVDSDDWIEENCLADIIAQCNNIDVLCLSYRQIFEDGLTVKKICPPTANLLDGKSLFKTKSFCMAAQFYVYRREFLIYNKLHFCEGIYHEDMEFTPKMLCLAKTVKVYTIPVYYYFIRPNSITTSVNPKRTYDLLKVARKLSDFCSKMEEKEIIRVFDYYVSICLNNALSLTKHYSKNVIDDLSLVFEQNKDLFRHLYDSPLVKNKIEGFLFLLFPRKCVLIYKLLHGWK